MRSLLPPELDTLWKTDSSATNAVRIRRQLAKHVISPGKAPAIRAGFIGSFTLDVVRDFFEVACLAEGIAPTTYLGAFQQYPQELLDPKSPLASFDPEVTFLALDARSVFGDAYDAPPPDDDLLARRGDAFLDDLFRMIQAFQATNAGRVVIHSLELPAFDMDGIRVWQGRTLTSAVRRFNSQLVQRALECGRAWVLDYEAVLARVGKISGVDEKLRLLAGFCVGNVVVPFLVTAQLGYVKAMKGLTRKCIVLDLDNTLWGGIVGEDGFDGIALGPTPPGNAFVEFQRTLLGYFRRGIVLAVNSRNNPDDAMLVIREHPYQVLREEHFGCFVINWEDKATNLGRVAKELNIGMDSLVFFDDDPMNRSLVRDACPEVLTVEMPSDPAHYCRALLSLNDFAAFALTEEDRKRGAMYASERSRRQVKAVAVDIESFLESLQIRVKIQPADDFLVPRIAQLTQRTNQFNMTTRRYTAEEIANLASQTDMRVVGIHASDRFGDSGTVGVAIVRCEAAQWHIDAFLLSCRVLGRRIEDALIWWIAEEARKSGAKTMRAEFIPTTKNAPARDFYPRVGFQLVNEDGGRQLYVAEVAKLAAARPRRIECV